MSKISIQLDTTKSVHFFVLSLPWTENYFHPMKIFRSLTIICEKKRALNFLGSTLDF